MTWLVVGEGGCLTSWTEFFSEVAMKGGGRGREAERAGRIYSWHFGGKEVDGREAVISVARGNVCSNLHS